MQINTVTPEANICQPLAQDAQRPSVNGFKQSLHGTTAKKLTRKEYDLNVVNAASHMTSPHLYPCLSQSQSNLALLDKWQPFVDLIAIALHLNRDLI